MPGPGRGSKKTGPRPVTNAIKAIEASTPETYVDEVDSLSFDEVGALLAVVYKVPDLSKRSGLKKAHANFDDISRRLDKASARYSDNLKIVGGVAAVYMQMTRDSLLCRKLHEKGFMKDMDRLLAIEETRVFALKAFIKITCYSPELRGDIIERIPALLILLGRYPDDPQICEPIIDTLCHCIMAVYDDDSVGKDDHHQDTLNPAIPYLVRLVTDFLTKDWASPDMVRHAYELLLSFYGKVDEAITESEPFQRFLVAGLTSSHWVIRSTCMKGLILMVYSTPRDDDLRYGSPEEFLDEVEESAPHLYEIMRGYGLKNCYSHMVTDAMDDLEEALEAYALDNSSYSLGLKLAQLLPRMNRVHILRAFHPTTQQNGGWRSLLPQCVEAVRSKGEPAEEPIADILEVGYLLLQGQNKVQDAVKLAAKAVARDGSSAHAYFFYALLHSACDSEALQAHISGLRATNTNRHLRFRLARRIVTTGCLMATKVLTRFSCGYPDWESVSEAATLLRISYTNAKFYLENSPPDDPDRGAMASFFIILSFLTKGDRFKSDLSEFQRAQEIRKLSQEFSEETVADSKYTAFNGLPDLILKFHEEAIADYGVSITKLDTQDEMPNDFNPPEQWSEDLVEWRKDGRHTHNDNVEEHEGNDSDHENPSLLYRCANCDNVSAVMRKCSRCLKTRYCDAKCQKAHWKKHKKECLSQRSTS